MTPEEVDGAVGAFEDELAVPEPTDEHDERLQARSDLQHYDLADLRKGARAIAEARKQARQSYTRQALLQADGENEYRRLLATHFAVYRDGGMPVEESMVRARGEEEVRLAKQKRDRAASYARAAWLRVEELERNAATQRQIADWSQKMSG